MPRAKTEPGEIVALVGCTAYDERGQHTRELSGLFEVVEHHDADPSLGRCCAGWTVIPKGALAGDWEEHVVWVEDYELWSQLDPAGFGEWLAEERRAEVAC